MHAQKYCVPRDMADRTCGICGKVFNKPFYLKRHLERLYPCAATPANEKTGGRPRNECDCGRTFAHSSSLSKHKQKACKLRKTDETNESKSGELKHKVRELEVRLAELAQAAESKACPSVIINNSIHNGDNIVVNQGAPGWPSGWRHPLKDPAPFEPPSFTLSLEDLETAARLCPDAGGEPGATASFLMELLRRVHANPTQQNVYPDPNRGDHVLTFAFRHWEVRRLMDALRVLYARLETELEEVAQLASPSVQKVAEEAQTALRGKRGEIIQESRGALHAHLTNLRIATEAGESWLGAAAADTHHEVRPFGREWRSHLKMETALMALEHELENGRLGGQGEEKDEEAAARVLVAFARLILRGQPKNLTVVLLPGQARRAAIRTDEGWQDLPAEEAAARLTANMAESLCAYIRRGDSPALARLVPALQNNAALAVSAGDTLLEHYTAAAEVHYLMLPDASHGPCQEARQLLKRRPAATCLDDLYLAELMGF